MGQDARHDVQAILGNTVKNTEWKIVKPQDGLKKECFIASSESGKVFIKFDIPAKVLIRLGEIGVAPKVLYSGVDKGETYVIQEFIDGDYPDRAWIKSHPKAVADCMNVYHADAATKNMLAESISDDYEQNLEEDLRLLASNYRRQRTKLGRVSNFDDGVSQFFKLSGKLKPTSLVPVHNEPNRKNMLVAGGQLIFIDWDEITLSDPLRDIGLFLWWYYPPQMWSTILPFFKMNLNCGVETKIYWFAARASLEVALWYEERGNDGSMFIGDFLAAIEGNSNPQGY